MLFLETQDVHSCQNPQVEEGILRGRTGEAGRPVGGAFVEDGLIAENTGTNQFTQIPGYADRWDDRYWRIAGWKS